MIIHFEPEKCEKYRLNMYMFMPYGSRYFLRRDLTILTSQIIGQTLTEGTQWIHRDESYNGCYHVIKSHR